MSFTKAKAYLESVGFADHIIEPEASTATVVEAAGNDHSAVRPRMGGRLQESRLKKKG